MSSIIVLGGGRQGGVIARDLGSAVADVRAGAGTVQADLSDPSTLVRLISGYDLVVGALPSRFGFAAMRAAIEARRNLVDLSFCPENALSLDSEARRAGVLIVPDCGLAPGLSNLLVGTTLDGGPPDEIRIRVGGIAQDRTLPYGYVITWSVEDLLEEYTRPAHVIRGGRRLAVPALSDPESVEIEGVGTLEAFTTDGLRTLLETVEGVRDMEERTLRWPGHREAVEPLLARGTLVETFRAECAAEPPRDLVVLQVLVRRGHGVRRFQVVDRFDERSGLTAMTRTTALTCAAVARLVASGAVRERGVVPLERLAKHAPFVLDGLRRHGVGVP